MMKLSGYSKSDTQGQSLVERFILDEYKAQVRTVLEQALGGSETANFEFLLENKNGERVHMLLNATTRRDADGEITGVVGVGQDITELNHALATSSNIADDLTRLIETANAPIFGVDLSGLVTEWNDKMQTLSGYSKTEAQGLPLVQRFIIDDYKVQVRTVLEQALAGTESANFEFPLFSKDGKRVQMLLNATTRRDAEGRVTGVVGVGQDITELNQALAKVSIIADDLTRLIETANAPIFGVDLTGHVTEWNNKMMKLSGYSKSDTQGQPLVERFILDEYKDQVLMVLEQALGGTETANFEFLLENKNGERVHMLLNATTRRDA